MSAKTLIIVESPSKAKTISKYLGDQFIVRASYGHIIDLISGGKEGIGVDIANEFMPKYEIIPAQKDKLKTIFDAAVGVKEILIASDPDREGEAIAFLIAELLQKKFTIPIKRVKFQEITKTKILEGIKNAGEIDQNLFAAQKSRRVIDRLVGYMVSPFLINSIGPNLSAGRVQSAAVKMVIDKEREIENFKPEEYWNISVCLAKSNSTENFTAKYSNKVTNQIIADKIKKDLDSDKYEISSVTEVEKARNPSPPFITSSLAISAAGRYKFPAAKTMKAAQSLYESGLITYMRTDSVRSSPEAIDACREWLTKNKHDLPTKSVIYKTKNSAQDAHEAIRPTDVYKIPPNIFVSEDEQKIYRLIWERFVASQMNPALYDTVSIIVESSSGHLLKANGRVLKYKGWLEITGDFENDDEGESKLPILKIKDKLILVPPKVKAEKKVTQPPPRYSEKTLIKELERQGIGRPSTYAAIMSKITDRSYVVKKGEMFNATDTGKKVVDALAKHFTFMDTKYTASMEEELDKIADGKMTYLTMMNDFYTPFSEELKKAYTANRKDYGFICDKCQKKMYLRHGRFGFFMACSDYPDICKNTISCDMVDEKPIPKDQLFNIEEGVSCPTCSKGMVKRDGKFGPFYICSDFNCKGKRKVPFGKKCSDCGGELYSTFYKEENVLFCMNYPKCFHKESIVGFTNPQKVNQDNEIPKKIAKVLNKKIT